MLTGHDLAAARADAERTLPGTGQVLAFSSAPDGGGGYVETYTAGASVACRIAPAGGGETGARGERVDDRTTHVLTLPAGTAITARDRFQADGVVYEVTAVRRRTTEITRRVELREAP